MLCYQLPDLGYQIVRDTPDRRGGFDTSLILGHGLVFGLLFVLGEYSPYSILIPSLWKLVLAH